MMEVAAGRAKGGTHRDASKCRQLRDLKCSQLLLMNPKW